MRSKQRSLNIIMNGILIGCLIKKSNTLSFTYDESWLNTAGARPLSLSLPLIRKTYEGDEVYNFFDNLLPDNPQIRARIQANLKIATSQPFDLLASIGRDCVGAIQIMEGQITTFSQEIKCQHLSDDEIASTLRDYYINPLGMNSDGTEFRISIPGAQEKSAFLYHQGKWCRPLNETATTHIFKLPIGYLPHQQIDLSDSCENEWLCSRVMSAFGIPVAKCEICLFEEIKVLVVERFDRKLSSDGSWVVRLPQEDICQALGLSPNLKYQSDGGPGINEVMKLLLGSANHLQDRDLFYRSQVIFWLLAAIDGHAKNFSIFIEPEGRFRLTPMYDIISAYPLIAKKQLQAKKIKMAMALRGKNNHYLWHSIQRRHFLETAKAVHYSVERAEIILDEVLSQVDGVIESVLSELPKDFPENISQPIFTGMISMKNKLK